MAQLSCYGLVPHGWEDSLLRLLVLPVSDNVTQVCVVQVACHIQGEVGEHLVYLLQRNTVRNHGKVCY